MKPDLSKFDTLPDDARVPVQVLAGVMGIGVSTAWLFAKTVPNFPKLTRLGPKCTRARVGDIRSYLRDAEAAN